MRYSYQREGSNKSQFIFSLRFAFILHLLVQLLDVHLPTLHTPLTNIVFSDGVYFEMQLLFGNCRRPFAPSSCFHGFRIFENGDQR